MTLKAQIKEKESELKYNKRRLFKRAHYLVRTEFKTFSQALKQVWKEQKEYRKDIQESIEVLYHKLSLAFTPQHSEEYMEVFNYKQMVKADINGTNLNKWYGKLYVQC